MSSHPGRWQKYRARFAPRLVEERRDLRHDHRVLRAGPRHQRPLLRRRSLPLRLALGQRAVAGDVERRHLGHLEDRDRLAHRLLLVDAGGIAEQRRPGRALRQPVAGLAADLDEEGIDLRHQSRSSSLIPVFERVRSSTRLTMTAQ